MKEDVRYFLNEQDSAQPIYEVNFTTKRWRVVKFRSQRGYDNQGAQGRVRDHKAFSHPNFVAVEKPAGLRVA